ncbi:MAG TPA: Gfo/Idh/MocA family oxidoreductase, partial [Planctomycetaceae bacterium]|nr:Gfo/Idh/MocA family oxidoreductase [Planctomycetaceae bacterium]
MKPAAAPSPTPRSVDAPRQLRGGMVGMGMIFDETYRPFFEQVRANGLYDRSFGTVEVPLVAVASRTGKRAETYLRGAGAQGASVKNLSGPDAVESLLRERVDFACVATPDDRHFEAAKQVLEAGVHLLIEKPSVLSLSQLDELLAIARRKQVLAKVVYHKLLDPDHKKLR